VRSIISSCTKSIESSDLNKLYKQFDSVAESKEEKISTKEQKLIERHKSVTDNWNRIETALKLKRIESKSVGTLANSMS
jgi:hypothetical protein